MTAVLRIRKSGEPERTLELAPGQYSLGRAPDNEVVLADVSVSSRHARLTVTGRDIRIKDLDSRNGVFVQGRRVGSETFVGPVEVEIGAFRLSATLSASPASAQAPDLLASGPGRRLLDVRLLIPAVAVLLALASALLVQAPLKERFEEARLREAAKRGFILARYLAEMNVPALKEKRYEQARAEPVSAEEGVLYASVADPYGKVLAPAKRLGSLLDQPQVSQAVKQGTMKAGPGPEGETVICWPVKDLDTVLGVAVIGYAAPAAAQALTFRDTALALVIPLALGGLAALGLLAAVIAPVRRLAEQAGLALKQGGDRLEYAAPYKELGLVAQAFDRLLRLLPRAAAPAQPQAPAPAAPPPRDPGQPPQPPQAQPGRTPRALDNTSPFISDLHLLYRPWCLADVRQFSLLMHNPLFLSLVGRKELSLPAHLLEVFADPQVLEALTILIEKPETKASQARIRDRAVTVTRQEVPDQEGFAVFVFEETAHG